MVVLFILLLQVRSIYQPILEYGLTNNVHHTLDAGI